MSQLQVTGEAKIRDIQGPVIANSGVITALDGAASQYVRGDGTLADFPTSTGGGSSVSYYLNSSVSQGTIGGVAYRELNKEPIIGAGTDITISANGYVASYITDANDPDVLSVPGGNFNCEFYFSVNSDAHNPTFYAELYKYDGTTFTLLGSSQAVPESINQGTTIAPYYFAIPVATAALALTDRLAIRIYVNVDTRTVTLHTENSHLCQVVTTFSKGMVSLNNLTDQSQFITTGTSGTDFNIVSTGDTHTFNLPVASATNTGKLSSTDWSTFNAKQAALSFTAPLVNTSNTISIPAATSLVDGYLDNADWVKFNTAYNDSIVSAAVTGTTTKTLTLTQQDAGTITASWTDDNTDAVSSVFGRTGAVVAQSGDYNTSQVTELTNLYFTDARSRLALSFAAGSGAYNSTTGVITIPTNNNQITNGSNFITRTSLTATTPLFYNNTTGDFTIQQATSVQNGYLSSADWTTFNNKQSPLTNPVTGTGLGGAIPKFTTTGSTIGSSIIYDNGTQIGINTLTPSFTLDVNGATQFRDDIRFSTTNSSIGYTDSIRFVELGVSTRMTLASGNLGLGVTPSAWWNGMKAVEAQGSSGGVFASASVNGHFLTNGYYDGTNWVYKNTGFVSYYSQTVGQHQWLTAPSGTAGNAITFTQAMTLNASGNLGVGTSSPSERLHISSSASSTEIRIENSTTSAYIRSQTDNLNFYFNGADRMRIFSNGNIGVGTTTDAGYKLDVNGTGRFTGNVQVGSGAALSQLTVGNGAGYTGVVLSNASSVYSWLLGSQYNINNGFEITPSTVVGGSTFTTPVFKILNTGAATFSSSVTATGFKSQGIPNGLEIIGPTGSPAYAVVDQSVNNGGKRWRFGHTGAASGFGSFDIYNQTDNITALTIASTGAATFSSSVQTFRLKLVEASTATNFTLYSGVENTGSIGFYNETSGLYNLVIRNTGNVGIGTSSPGARLDVVSDAGANAINIRTRDSANDYAYINFKSNSGSEILSEIFIQRTAGNTAYLAFTTNNGSGAATERMRILPNGRVLIGTTSDVGYKLFVAGNFYVNNGAAGTLCNITDGISQTFQINTTSTGFDITNPNSGYISFSNTTERMRITSGGNVLIGTTTDSGQKMQVNGITKTAGLSLSGTTVSTTQTMTSSFYMWIFNGGSGQTLTLYDSSGHNNTHFIKNSSANSLTLAASNIETLTSTSTVSSITIPAYKTVQVISNGGVVWLVMNQS